MSNAVFGFEQMGYLKTENMRKVPKRMMRKRSNRATSFALFFLTSLENQTSILQSMTEESITVYKK